MSNIEQTVATMRVCYHLWKNGISPEKIPRQLKVGRATVYRWIRSFRRNGITASVRSFRCAKKNKRRRQVTDPITKRLVWKIRQERRKCCGEKIAYFLKKEHDIALSVTTVYRILGERWQLRTKWRKNVKRGIVLKGTKPREVLQTDTVDLGGLYAFTTVDTFTKEARVTLDTALTAKAGERAMQRHLSSFGKVQRMQRDGGSEFKRECERFLRRSVEVLRTARPYKKNEQAFIERFNGILRKECVGYAKYRATDLIPLQAEINRFLHYYHTERPHLSLGMLTPQEFVQKYTHSPMSHFTV